MRAGRYLAAMALAAAMLFAAVGAEGRRGQGATLLTVAVAELPGEARATLAAIRDNGPFPFSRDGVPFGNRERILPPKPRGYYHEYTVRTPGSRSRGARRIVCGGPPPAFAECYYSDDHYQSFKRIRP